MNSDAVVQIDENINNTPDSTKMQQDQYASIQPPTSNEIQLLGKCNVHFELNHNYRDNVYEQPIYYLADNYKLQIIKSIKQHTTINDDTPIITTPQGIDSKDTATLDKEKIDTNLKFENIDMHNINLQLFDYDSETVNQIDKFNYIINKSSTDPINFDYKTARFTLTPGLCKVNSAIPGLGHGQVTLMTYYDISFCKADLLIFEEFLKSANKYYKKYLLNNDDDDEKKIKIYVNPDEGGYFDFVASRSKRSLDTIYLPHKLKSDILDDITHFLLPKTKERYAKLGINYKRVYLFEGVPGAGKTSFIVALASHFNYDVAIVSFGPKFKDTDLIHLLRDIKDTSENKRKKFLILEDMDCIFKERKSNDEARNMISFSGLLNILDGLATPENLICFMTTNYKNHLDNALIRPGRIDYIMHFDYAVKEQICNVFTVYMDLNSENTGDFTEQFYNVVKDLHIKISVSLLQQYLLKYLDNPKMAIDNINELKVMYQVSIVDTAAEESCLFS